MGMLHGLRSRLRHLRDPGEGLDASAAPDGGRPARGSPLPDPAQPPARRGTWEEAALTNVEVTEVVKRQIRTVTRPWNK